MMVTCSKDRSIAVWDMISPNEINLRRVLVGHRAAVNVVDFDEKYIVSAIKVWNTSSCEFVPYFAGAITRCQYDIFLIKSHHVNSSMMTHQYTTQINFIWADHVPDCDGTILTAGPHHTIIKSETEIIKVLVRINTNFN